jgi:hypothetical protein
LEAGGNIGEESAGGDLEGKTVMELEHFIGFALFLLFILLFLSPFALWFYYDYFGDDEDASANHGRHSPNSHK